MDDKLSVRERISLSVALGPWLVVLGQAGIWVIYPERISWGMVAVWFFLLLVAIVFTMPAMPKKQ